MKIVFNEILCQQKKVCFKTSYNQESKSLEKKKLEKAKNQPTHENYLRPNCDLAAGILSAEE